MEKREKGEIVVVGKEEKPESDVVDLARDDDDENWWDEYIKSGQRKGFNDDEDIGDDEREDHVEVRIGLLLPVDHPIALSFVLELVDCDGREDEEIACSGWGNMDLDAKRLSFDVEVHFYCRSCSFQLSRGPRLKAKPTILVVTAKDVESEQIKAAKELSLEVKKKEDDVRWSSCDVLSLSYWNSNVVHYDEKVLNDYNPATWMLEVTLMA
ncbi:hypothetical protein Droror1_Dr00006515 [Drosera rotundifolia]